MPPMLDESDVSQVNVVAPRVPPATGDVSDFVIVQEGSAKGRDLLVDKDGYQYTQKVDKRRPQTITWRCSTRSCKGQFAVRDATFIRGVHAHTCTPQPGRVMAAQIRRDVKASACQRVFDSAGEITEATYLAHVQPGSIELLPTLPGKRNLARQANRKRQKVRPNNPDDLNFEIQQQFVAGGFLKGDVSVENKRHIILATDPMLALLSRARSWFIDGTFYLIRPPFTQLFSIHAFVKHGTTQKQVPLAFVVMSGRRAVDYTAVLRAILDLLPITVPAVQQVTADFEAAVWQSIRALLPNVKLSGCLFHFSQAIYRKLQELGLQVAYNADAGTRAVCRRLMALALLPQEHISPVFLRLQEQLDEETPDAVRSLFQYVEDTWINGRTFTPKDWSVFQKHVRTNNDVEGWHTRINTRGKKGQLPFYLLCHLLYEEARFVQITAEFVSREEAMREERQGYRRCTERLNKLWREYCDNQRSVMALLDAGSHLIAPRPDHADPQ